MCSAVLRHWIYLPPADTPKGLLRGYFFLMPADPVMSNTQQASVLSELRRELARILGDRFEAAYLFGSRARGDQRPDSDLDVLVVVRGAFDYGDLIRRTSALVSGLSLKYDTVIARAFVSKERFERERSPFLLNIRRE